LRELVVVLEVDFFVWFLGAVELVREGHLAPVNRDGGLLPDAFGRKTAEHEQTAVERVPLALGWGI